MTYRGIWVLLLAVGIAACSGFPKREDDRATLQRYLDFAGEPVAQFTYLGRLDGWRPLGRDRLVVWTGLNDAYLLTVASPCLDLGFATRIGVTSTGSAVSRGFDSILLPRGERCRILEIRPVDYRQVRAAEREAGR